MQLIPQFRVFEGTEREGSSGLDWHIGASGVRAHSGSFKATGTSFFLLSLSVKHRLTQQCSQFHTFHPSCSSFTLKFEQILMVLLSQSSYELISFSFFFHWIVAGRFTNPARASLSCIIEALYLRSLSRAAAGGRWCCGSRCGRGVPAAPGGEETPAGTKSVWDAALRMSVGQGRKMQASLICKPKNEK